MPVPVSQAWTVATYVLKQKLMGRERYPFVLMLEPLFAATWRAPVAARSNTRRIS